MQNYQSFFEKLVSKEFSYAEIDELKTICIATWYENFIPEINDFSEDKLRRSGYLVDKLMRFNCVSKEQKYQLKHILDSIKQKLCFEDNFLANVEPLAQKWNINSDLKHEFRELIFLQKRHYKHSE